MKCEKPTQIELGMGTLLETAQSINCGQWVKYACDPGYSFADKVMENAKCMSIREGSLVGVYTNKWDGHVKFIMPKCISSTNKHGKDNSLSIGTGIGGVLAASLLVAAGICAYRWFSNRRRDETVSVSKSLKTKILRKTHEKTQRDKGPDTYSDDGYLKPVPSDKCHSSCSESCDSIERWKGLVELEIRPPSDVKHVI